MSQTKDAAPPSHDTAGAGTDKVPAYSWYALSVLVLVYVLQRMSTEKSIDFCLTFFIFGSSICSCTVLLFIVIVIIIIIIVTTIVIVAVSCRSLGL